MGKLITTFDDLPRGVEMILEKLETLEKEMASLKEKYIDAPMVQEETNDLMRFQEAVSFLGISRNTLHVWVRNKKIPYTMIGTIRYFKKSDLESYNRVEVKKPKGL